MIASLSSARRSRKMADRLLAERGRWVAWIPGARFHTVLTLLECDGAKVTVGWFSDGVPCSSRYARRHKGVKRFSVEPS